MKSSLLIILFAVLSGGLITGCVDQKDPDLLPEDQLIRLITDAHLAEGALQNVGASELDSMTQLYYEQIFEIHGITEEEFKKNLDYLSRNSEYAERIYEQVVQEYTDIKLEK